MSDQLPMKPKKNAKGFSSNPFLFSEKKYINVINLKVHTPINHIKLQLATSGTKHTVTTPNGRILHRKIISTPVSDFAQEQNNRCIGPRGQNGRFIRSPSKQKQTTVIESDSELDTPLTDTENPKTPEHLDNTTLKKSTFGRGRPKLVRDRTNSNSPQASTAPGPLHIIATNMTDTEVNRAIEDAKCAEQEHLIRDENGKIFTNNNTNSNTLEDNLENSDLDLASDLSSSTEIDNEEKDHIRRSKILTKTNSIIRYDNLMS